MLSADYVCSLTCQICFYVSVLDYFETLRVLQLGAIIKRGPRSAIGRAPDS